jgi:hypothetical protein
MDVKRLVAVVAGLVAGAALAAATVSPALAQGATGPPPTSGTGTQDGTATPPPSGTPSDRAPVITVSPPATQATSGSAGPTAPAVRSGGSEDFPVGVIVGGAAVAAIVVLVLLAWAFRWRAHAMHVPRLRTIGDPGRQRVESESGRPLVALRATLDPAEITSLDGGKQ